MQAMVMTNYANVVMVLVSVLCSTEGRVGIG